jgi:hypothetical protein
LLAHQVVWSDLFPDGSSFRAAQTGPLILANDTWFAPSDLTIGPDGAVVRGRLGVTSAPLIPIRMPSWDRSNGRVFRVQAKDAKPLSLPLPDFANVTRKRFWACCRARTSGSCGWRGGRLRIAGSVGREAAESAGAA